MSPLGKLSGIAWIGTWYTWPRGTKVTETSCSKSRQPQIQRRSVGCFHEQEGRGCWKCASASARIIARTRTKILLVSLYPSTKDIVDSSAWGVHRTFVLPLVPENVATVFLFEALYNAIDQRQGVCSTRPGGSRSLMSPFRED